MLKKITSEESVEDRSAAELDALKHRDWVRDREDNTAVCLIKEGYIVFFTHVNVCVVWFPGASVGAADEGPQAGGEAEEGSGAALQPAAHRVQPHTL